MKRFILALCFMLCFVLPYIAWAGDGDLVTQGKAITGTLLFDVGATIDEFSTDGTFGDNSDIAVPTEKAVKTYGNANWNSFTELFNVKAYGATGDGITDDTKAIQDTVNAAMAFTPYRGTVYFPTGKYKITDNGGDVGYDNDGYGIEVTAGSAIFYFSIIGDVRGGSVIYTTENIAMLHLDAGSATGTQSFFGNTFSNLFFQGNDGATNYGILIDDTGTSNYMTALTFDNLIFEDLETGIRVDKTSDPGTGAGRFNWNLFTKIHAASGDIGIHFLNASGTGNVFSDSTFITEDAGIQIDGTDGGNVGDLVFTGLQIGVATNGIYLNSSNNAGYRQRVTVSASQMDAGATNGINFTNMHNFRVVNVTLGGATDYVLTNCDDYMIFGSNTAAAHPTIFNNDGDMQLQLIADTDDSGEEDNPSLLLSQDGGSVWGSLGFEGSAGTTFTGTTINAMYLVNAFASDLHLGTGGTVRATLGTTGNWIVTGTITSGSNAIFTGGANLFNIVSGTASLHVIAGVDLNFNEDVDIAVGAVVNIDESLTLTKALTVNGQAIVITGVGATRTFTLNEELTVANGSDVILAASGGTRTLTLTGSASLNQSLLTTSAPTFNNGTTIGDASGNDSLNIKAGDNATNYAAITFWNGAVADVRLMAYDADGSTTTYLDYPTFLIFRNDPDGIDSGAGATNRFTLTSAGNLTVSGTVTASCGVLTCYSADYVFEDGYDLLSLDEFQAFVDKESHLPNMTINNLEDGQMDLVLGVNELLIKTEEQALYILQLHSRLKALEQTLN